MLELAARLASFPKPELRVRRAVPADAPGIVAVLADIVGERVHSAIDRVWSVDEERQYLESLSVREAVHVAVEGADHIVGLQALDRWSAQLESMAHVGQVGTFLLPAWRRRGVGSALWRATAAFGHEARYEKFVVQIRSANTVARSFYRALGFAECGRLTRQVMIDGHADDEILMELLMTVR